ncbi:MAG: Branched-chain amino acid transporter, amino acid-binding protein [Myxococcales bacterium]|nr:Branched-chain amino acid transporter, amino acid-binding protein [Myxococcales bacterium]
MKAALLCVLVAGCSSSSLDVQLRVPSGDHPLAGADAVAVGLRDAAGQLLAFTRGAPDSTTIQLARIPAGLRYTIEVAATLGGDVLARGRSCSFDVDAAKPPVVPVWFSRIGRFAPTAGPDVERADAAAFAWAGGVLLAGGTSGGAPLATTEYYDPVAAKFVPGMMLSTARAGARAVALGAGTVLLIGGASKGAPAVEALTATHSTPEPAGLAPDVVEHAAAATGNGSVVVVGGRIAGTPTDGAWIITQAGASVEALPAMAHARALATLTSSSDDLFAPLFVVGGVDAVGPVADVEAFDPASQTFFLSGIKLTTPRSGHTVTRLTSGLFLVVGGVGATGEPIAEAEILDPIGRVARPLARLRVARSQHTATILPTGRVLISGGVDGAGTPVADAELFDPALGAEGDFVPTSPLDSARAGHAVAPLCDGTDLVVGGASGAEIYNPL